uniref:Uncharacterized protein n=1 Tax=Anguilla anguilla TaxID=7936 RepID=A0A0E9VZE3_ANGAN
MERMSIYVPPGRILDVFHP